MAQQDVSGYIQLFDNVTRYVDSDLSGNWLGRQGGTVVSSDPGRKTDNLFEPGLSGQQGGSNSRSSYGTAAFSPKLMLLPSVACLVGAMCIE
ncbi:hypothetical protein [Bradyrhizobium sp. Leo121]|uniref:hypothetical protein n=1 Tax=Bradyrhizobium sp. Leo121 TaxID=1571195 RepID=UPI001029BC91|nr:hypothetical protein [Bradyrhizobium sp. Leo121]RZN27611.1 hypothetical protein CWO90_24645 [Bradyrhizobium sp. Leo121]